MNFTTSFLRSTILVFAIFNLVCFEARAFLGIDINDQTNTSPTQTDFFGVDVIDGETNPIFASISGVETALAPTGTVEFTITSPNIFFVRDRTDTPPDAGAFTYNAVYRDVLATIDGPYTFTLNGLEPSTTFEVTFFGYDHANASNPTPNTVTFTNTTGGASAPFGSITYGLDGGGPVAANDQYAVTLQVISDASGQLTFEETSNGPQGGPVFNGMSINVIPEPGSALLFLIGTGSALTVRRRRNA